MTSPHGRDSPSLDTTVSANAVAVPEQGELVQKNECWIFPDDAEESFSHWEIFWSDGNDYYYYHYPLRNLPQDLSTLISHAKPVPKSYYAKSPIPHGLRPAPSPLPEDAFIKQSIPLLYDPSSPNNTRMADKFVREARIYEILAENPHRHICLSYGYIEIDGFLTGLCIKRYGKTLHDAVDDGDTVNVRVVVDGVQCGLEHLHELGLVHGDIKPENIVLDSMSQPIIIDFDCCRRKGESTMGWDVEWGKESEFAEEENDWYSFEKVKNWLEARNV